jgi:hypothetical protein
MSQDSLFVIMSPNIDAVPENKKDITVDPNEMQKELARHFSRVEFVNRERVDYYFCRK